MILYNFWERLVKVVALHSRLIASIPRFHFPNPPREGSYTFHVPLVLASNRLAAIISKQDTKEHDAAMIAAVGTRFARGKRRGRKSVVGDGKYKPIGVTEATIFPVSHEWGLRLHRMREISAPCQYLPVAVMTAPNAGGPANAAIAFVMNAIPMWVWKSRCVTNFLSGLCRCSDFW